MFPCCRTSCCPCITEEKCAGSSRCCCDIKATGCCGPGPCCEWRCCGFGCGLCYSSDSPDGGWRCIAHAADPHPHVHTLLSLPCIGAALLGALSTECTLSSLGLALLLCLASRASPHGSPIANEARRPVCPQAMTHSDPLSVARVAHDEVLSTLIFPSPLPHRAVHGEYPPGSRAKASL